MDIDGIIFDLDGTLWDSCKSVSESWQKTIRRYYDPDRVFSVEQIRGIMGMTVDSIAGVLLPDFGDRALEACLKCLDEECDYIAKHGADIYPHAGLVLSALSRRHKLFIVSNCLGGYIECFLSCTGFGPFFTCFLNQSSLGLDKAGNIRHLIQNYALRRPVYIGDTELDRQSALEAGCEFIHAAYGFGQLTGNAVAIHSLAELEPAIAALSATDLVKEKGESYV